jgi:hypothetical protein
LEFAGHRRVTKGAFGQNNFYNSTILVRIFFEPCRIVETCSIELSKRLGMAIIS